MEEISKESLVIKLKEIRNMGWVPSVRSPGNAGAVGNTLEQLLGIKENNLPIPNAAEWELKAQRLKSNSLSTLFHIEPSPRAFKFVPQIFLPIYGWQHQEAGKKYPSNEMSFRQTITCGKRTDRGFTFVVDHKQEMIVVSFDKSFVGERHHEWLANIVKNNGGTELDPQPYWSFDELYCKAGTKLHNCFFIGADHKIENKVEYFHYKKIMILSGLSKEKLIETIDLGDILIDFDARTGHNHGTKFRYRANKMFEMYEHSDEVP